MWREQLLFLCNLTKSRKRRKITDRQIYSLNTRTNSIELQTLFEATRIKQSCSWNVPPIKHDESLTAHGTNTLAEPHWLMTTYLSSYQWCQLPFVKMQLYLLLPTTKTDNLRKNLNNCCSKNNWLFVMGFWAAFTLKS